MRWHYSLFLFIISQSCVHNTFISDTYLLLLRNSSVGGASNLRVLQLSFFSISGRAKSTLLFPEISDWVWDHPASCSVVSAVLSPDESSRTVKHNFYLHLIPSRRIRGNYLHFPICLPRVHRVSFTFCCCCLCCRCYFKFDSTLKDISRWQTTRRTMRCPM